MRRIAPSRVSAFQAGLIALVVILIATFLAFTKDIPFTKQYELKATFQNSPPIQKNQAVRIAGVDVGKVSKVEPVGGDSTAIVNQSLLGTDLHDLSKLVGGQHKMFAALDTHEGSLKDLITDFNTTMGAS